MIWSSIISGIAGIVAAGLGFIIKQKINQVHILVNNRLDLALKEIDDLKTSLKYEKTQPAEQGKHKRDT